jgi:hypothetical protein
MYRNYEEYESALDKLQENAPANVKIKKKTRQEFDYENYRDKIEWYLMEEWGTEPFHEIFFGHLTDIESDEPTPEDFRAEELHGCVYDIIDSCYEKKFSVNQAASKIYLYLKKEKAI